MYRLFIGHILLLTLVLQTFSGYLLKADYVLNQSLYEERCENKARPQLKCKGKCQLSKKMMEAEKEEQKQQVYVGAQILKPRTIETEILLLYY